MANMMHQIVTAWPTAALVGSLITLLGVFYSNREHYKRLKYEQEYQANLNKKKLYLQKGEELYSLLNQWSKQVYINHENFLDNRKSDKSLKETYDSSRIQTLSALYFPEINESLNSTKFIESKIFAAYEINSMTKYDDFLDDDCIKKLSSEVINLAASIESLIDELKSSLSLKQ